MPPAPPAVACPNCYAAVAPGTSRCQVCKLEVSQMAAYAAAKKAAQQRGIKSTAVETNETPAWRNPVTLIKTVILLALLAGVGGLGYHFFGPKPPRYLPFPATAQDATREFLTRLCAGDAAHDGAYALIADAARNPRADDIRGDFLQVFHNLNDYLTAEFGNQWITQTKLAPDPADPNLIVAKVALETLHIRTAQQTPPDKMQQYGPHYGILGIDEIDVSWAADLRQMGAITGIVGGIAGRGAVNNLNIIIGASEGNRHLPKFLKKMELLQILRNHWTATWKSVVHTCPFRDDPVVQARLTDIKNNDQYEPQVRDYARKVLEDKVAEEDKIAAGLQSD
jgi:hypothetical protein